MAGEIMLSPLGFHRIFHPTDLSPESEVAFVHALKLALVAKTEFTIMHTAPKKKDLDLQELPQVRATLKRWNVPPDALKDMQVKKVGTVAKNPARGIIDYLSRHPTGLVVLSTSQRDGLARWSRASVAQPVARAANRRTFFLPAKAKGFVSVDDGSVTLRTILIPAAQSPDSQVAVDAAELFAKAMGIGNVTFHILHVGPKNNSPALQTTQREGWSSNRILSEGDVVDRILATGVECRADLIVMVTEGQKSFSDMLKGSTTERVVRGAHCPVITLPAG